MADEQIDTTNRFLVATGGDGIVFLRPLPRRMTNDDALNLAAYLVSMVGDDEQWNATLSAAQNT